MQHQRRAFLARNALALAALLPGVTTLAIAQPGFPDKPIRLVVPFPAGGPTDTASRIIGQKMSETLRQPVVIDNRPGASGTIGTDAVAKAAPDGYTIVMLATPALLGPHLMPRKPYDVARDFAPIGNAYELPIVMVVNPQVLPDVTDLQQYIAKVKANPGKMNYTSSGNGSFGHLSTELLKNVGHFEVQHVPYKGSAPAMSDLLAGQVSMMFSDMIAALPHIKAGKLRPIAVGSARRVSFAPEVKTIAEQGFPGFDATSWAGLLAPAGTPKDVVQKLSDALQGALADPTVQQKMLGVGTVASYLPPDKFAGRIKDDYVKWGKVIKDNGIKSD
ncbi:Extra-cytoplasmic solute receptor [Cupriavidus sp. H19C3]|uniref:Bug family tripartite tricarboxylate transporter substrate binding protein n=1 Tax=Cupriavidus sp. H19C3 TaxID=3241603 RepID=UPI003BF88AA4